MRKILLEGGALFVGTTLFLFTLSEIGLRGFYLIEERSKGTLEEQLKRSETISPEEIGETDSLRGLIQQSAEPDTVYELRPNLKGIFLKRPFTFNSFGIRDREYAIEKPANTFRIVGLGDSVMFGWGVNEAESYLSQIEEKLNAGASSAARHFEVLNFAVPGYNTTMEVSTLEHRALLFQPDLVILHFVNNDWGVPYFMEHPRDVFALNRSYFWEFVKEKTLNLLSKQKRATGLVSAERNGLSKIENEEVLGPYRHMLGREGFETALARLAELTRPRNIPVIIVVGSGSAEQKQLLESVARDKYGFQIVRVGPYVERYIQNLGKPLTKRARQKLLTLSPQDPHPNALGHRLYGEALFDALRERGYVSAANP